MANTEATLVDVDDLPSVTGGRTLHAIIPKNGTVACDKAVDKLGNSMNDVAAAISGGAKAPETGPGSEAQALADGAAAIAACGRGLIGIR